MRTVNNTPPHLSRGSAIIAIFWIIAVLGMAVFASLSVVKIQSDLASSESHTQRARALAERGIALATHPNIANDDPLLSFTHEDGFEGFQARSSSLSQTFGFNALVNEAKQLELSGEGPVSESFLYILFNEGWGLDESDAQTLVHCLIEWSDTDDQVTTLTGWERPQYESEGFFGRPYNRFFKSLDEVKLVHGYSALEEARPDWANFFNVWTNGKIDLSSAEPEIIALASLTPTGQLIDLSSATLLVERLRGEDGIPNTKDDNQNSDLLSLLSEYSSGDPTPLSQRYSLEGNAPIYQTIESLGWSGTHLLEVKLSLHITGSRPLLLNRVEKLGTKTYE